MSKKSGAFSGGRGAVFALVMFGLAAFLVYRTLFTAGPPTPELIPVMFKCSETGKTFEYAMHEGDRWPVVSPYTNKNTGYPVERCYWTRDGKRKLTPTYVILNENLGKPGDTICPDCGRVVVGHNPPPPPDIPLADPAVPPKSAQPAAPLPKAPPPAASKPVDEDMAKKKAETEGVLFATVRAKMDELIAQRATMLKAGSAPTDPVIRQMEDAILRAQQTLKENGESVPDVQPPITASAPAPPPASKGP